jgi:hypothetical protein
MAPILDQMNLVHIHVSDLVLYYLFISNLPSTIRSPLWSLSFRFYEWTCVCISEVNTVMMVHSLTHLLSWALLEKLTVLQLLKNLPAFYCTRRFITAFTRALHWSLSWARSIQFIQSHPISLRSILMKVHYIQIWRGVDYWDIFIHTSANALMAVRDRFIFLMECPGVTAKLLKLAFGK